MKRANRRREPRSFFIKQKCHFCESKTEPDYKDYSFLSRFLNIRGGILGRRKTGVCTKHQRQLSEAVKRARHLALLPFVTHLGVE